MQEREGEEGRERKRSRERRRERERGEGGGRWFIIQNFIYDTEKSGRLMCKAS